MTVLVACASAHRSTQGIAERLASKLSELGIPAESRWVEDVADVGAYSGVVLGSVVHNQRWLPAAWTFIRAHRGSS